ncbi:transcription factor BOA-like [Bidens hawaiensis]|uniref:transcription factor BOA-like n=1 Tax=Bidens hawaiensis TaxID=980011 RepID=UPI00404A9790
MAEEVRLTGGEEEDDERVSEWEDGLPDGDDLTPLSQLLISSELLSAFSITPEPYRSMIDVNRASRNTISSLRGESEQPALTGVNGLKSFIYNKRDAMDADGDGAADLASGGSDCRKLQRIGSSGDGAVEETETEIETETEHDLQGGDASARVSKRQRLVWTPQLHKRFIEVVAHLGVKNAVPKTIMQLMNVEGLTRENVASHLQKYRLYLKRMHGNDSGGGSNGYRPVQTPYSQQVHHVPYNTAVQQRWYGNGSQHGMSANNK